MIEYEISCLDLFLEDFCMTLGIAFFMALLVLLVLKSRKFFRMSFLLLLFIFIALIFVSLECEAIAPLISGGILALLLSLFVKVKDSTARKVLGGALVVVILVHLMQQPYCILWGGFGYELKDGKLEIKSWPIKEIVNITSSRVTLTSDEEWKPKWRLYGYADPDLLMGYYRLENGVKAVVFKHKESEKFVVINSSGKYYVIIHPGVENLYEEIRRTKGE
jgi:hypothetical protein